MQGKKKDLLGLRFGKLLVIAEAESRKTKSGAEAVWLCRCDCGSKVAKPGRNLTRGRLLSCGCIRANTHGHNRRGQRTPTYGAWVNMRGRCFNKKNKHFQDYGGRGITVCERWLKSFDNFLADMGSCPKGLTLERRDVNGNYEPSNCFWASGLEQASNKRRTAYVTYNGVRQPIARLARSLGLPPNVIYERIVKYGWSVDDAISAPIESRIANRVFEYKGSLYTLSDLAKIAMVNKRALYSRLTVQQNWTVETAVETPAIQPRQRWLRLKYAA